jgi:nucleoside phosphorylase
MVPHVDVLLVTANEHETQAVLQVFEEATKSPAKPVPLEGRVYRDLGTVNQTRVFHALSEMGSGGPGATQQTVDKAIRALNPGSVIAFGIAFGVNEKKQAIGDILISEQLRLYDLQRAGRDIILRGDKPHASTRLINFFKGVAQTSWQGPRVRPGVILTGDKLVDNMDYRDQLIRFEPEAVGGEMEGAGLYVASNDHKVDWIVIKAICDWGDGHKGKNKNARQKKAAKTAADFVLHTLQQVPLQHPLGIGASQHRSMAFPSPSRTPEEVREPGDPIQTMEDRLRREWVPLLHNREEQGFPLDEAVEALFDSIAPTVRSVPHWLDILERYSNAPALPTRLPKEEEEAIRVLRNLGLLSHDGKWLFTPTRATKLIPTSSGALILALRRQGSRTPTLLARAFVADLAALDAAALGLLDVVDKTRRIPAGHEMQVRDLRNRGLITQTEYFLAASDKATLTKLGSCVLTRTRGKRKGEKGLR